MGTYLNPGNSGFTDIRRGRYVDKTNLIARINETIGTPEKLTCISRPRRFGKSYAAQMLCAYYDKTCDSGALFDDLAIAHSGCYKEHLNKYDVIYLNMTDVLGETSARDLIGFIKRNVVRELLEAYPSLLVVEAFGATLANAVQAAGSKFIMIIDEWDAPIRENPEIHQEYLEFLRTLFKSSATTAKTFAAAYMTGILPIKKDGSQSAISDFMEYSMLKPADFAEFVGFTEEEVIRLCKEFSVDFTEMKRWYDGYTLRNVGSVYNPNSVMKAIRFKDFDSYWTETSAAGSLLRYINRDVDGLGKTIAELTGGVKVDVDTKSFSNDLITFTNQDDVLTLLIHLGYLAYDEQEKKAHIPNEEVRLEFARTIREDRSPDTIKRVAESDRLIMDTIHQNCEAVAAQIEKIHMEATNPLNANNENSLRAVIQLAYFSYKDYYLKMEELPTGLGYADIVYLPKRGKSVPALLVELKWNHSAKTAIDQIKEKKYPEVLQGYGGELLLVGLNYNKDTTSGDRQYSCMIERWQE
ncbi:MAG: AAA family ATPase [Blautia sp.]|nr:AAA family ATPase [Blautia sp.]